MRLMPEPFSGSPEPAVTAPDLARDVPPCGGAAEHEPEQTETGPERDARPQARVEPAPHEEPE